MRLLRFSIKGAPLFADAACAVDLFATDRVVGRAGLDSPEEVHKVGDSDSIFSLNVIGLSGVNASGKTTLLNLLHFILTVLTGRFSIRRFKTPEKCLGKLGDRLAIMAVFWHEGQYYLIESTLERLPSGAAGFVFNEADQCGVYGFAEETVWMFSANRINRATIIDADRFKDNAQIIICRNAEPGEPGALSEDVRTVLGHDVSVASLITRRISVVVESPDRKLPAITMPTEVVQAFDGSIERLAWDTESQVFHLKFNGEEERIVGMNAAVAMLSRGTVYGSELVDHAISVLQEGGYLIVDEIEESLNRSLVKVVIDLFASPVTNPHGAQLVFSTHYPELLDTVRRKDAIYVLVRDEEYRTHVIKYSNEIRRIENKKSDVIISNGIAGSMPRYPQVQALREHVKERVCG